MITRSKIIYSSLAIFLLSIINIILFILFDVIVDYWQSTYKININYYISLVISALVIAIIAYYVINKLSINSILISEKNKIETKLKQALIEIKRANKDLLLEIAERNNIEKDLIESEGQIRTIIQKAPTGIALLDKDGWILECNSALQNMLGYDHDELSGVLFVQAIHPQDVDLYKKKFTELINGSSDIYRIDSRYIHREFHEVWGSLSASVVRDVKGLPQFVIAMVEDITTKHQAEEKIVNYQKQLQSLTSELSLIEERERRRLATNLHDQVGQVLTLIGIKIDELHNIVPITTCGPLIDEISNLIKQTIKCIRSLIFELSPPILYDLGLEEAIEWLAEHFQKEYGIKIKVDKDEQLKPLKTEGTIILFQAVKELLYNIVKHAQATTVIIYIQRACNDLRIIIEDDGVGFEINLIDHKQHKLKGFGLFSIYERLGYYGGSMIIDSNKSQGTKITLLMPMLTNSRESFQEILEKSKKPYSHSSLTAM